MENVAESLESVVKRLFVAGLVAAVGFVSCGAVRAQDLAAARPAASNPGLSGGGTLYVHGFRAPSTGLEFRRGDFGVHAGLYTTILGRGGRSTEFVKVGVTGYFPLPSKRLAGFASVSLLRGLNRDYRDRNAFFVDAGFRTPIGPRLEFRLGAGMISGGGQPTRVNPVLGVSWSVPIR